MYFLRASLVAQRIKHLPIMQETRVLSLGWEDPLEKEMATHYSILAWEIPWTEELGRLQSMASQRVRHDWATKHSTAQLEPQKRKHTGKSDPMVKECCLPPLSKHKCVSCCERIAQDGEKVKSLLTCHSPVPKFQQELKWHKSRNDRGFFVFVFFRVRFWKLAPIPWLWAFL